MRAPRRPRRSPSWRVVVGYVLGLSLGALVVVLVARQSRDFSGASRRLAHLSWPFATTCVVAEALSLLAYAGAQRYLLGVGGVRVSLGRLYALTLANDAIALTVPGEPAVSSLFRFRQYRRYGATAAAAGWTIVTLIVAQALALSLLLLGAVVVALAESSPRATAGLAVFALVLVVVAAGLLVRRDALFSLGERFVRAARRVGGTRGARVLERLEKLFREMRAVELRRSGSLVVLSLALGAWLADALCLVASFRAVNAGVPWRAVVLAYGIAQVVAVVPLVPGGLGLVEGSLAAVLVAYGTPVSAALAAVLVYRVVSYWAAAAFGWVSVGALTWRHRRDDRASERTVALRRGRRLS